jgi:hypothetical protein
VESRAPDAVLGEVDVVTRYSAYRDVGGVKFPGRIEQSMAGHPVLDVTVREVQPNAAVDIAPPDAVRSASERVTTEKLADGVWHVAGGSHNSVAIEMRDHFVLVETPDPSRVPFRLQLNLFNKFRYLNQQLASDTFTDHLGNVRPVDSRNDFNLNRNLYYFGGYVFDPKMIFNIIIWSSNSVATVIQGGYIGYQFDPKTFTLYAGYWGVPGSRSNTRNFMFLEGVERSMADSFMRPGFTQGIWAEGLLFDEMNYVAYIGNSANTLNVGTSKIDTNLIYAGSVWWEPLGPYNPPGPYKMAYSDLEYHECVAIRLGSSASGSREDRFSASGANNPENVALYNSDGVLTFETGSFAKGVTIQLANFYMWAQDFGIKYRGFAFNFQHFSRWLNNFRADGPLPLTGTFDDGFEASAGYFIIPKTFELYGRSSAVFGQFRNSSEYAGGFNWHPWQNRGFRLIGEANYVNKSPTASVQTIYNAGMVGWNFVLQTQLYF